MKPYNGTWLAQSVNHSVLAPTAPAQGTKPAGKIAILNRLGIALKQELANSAPPVSGQLNSTPSSNRTGGATDIPMNNNFSGWFGERATAWGLSHGLDPRYYLRVDDLIIPNGKGGTAQLDHVVLSQFGIFVVETKNRTGLIAGFPGEWVWRQTSGGKTYYFQNPVQQND